MNFTMLFSDIKNILTDAKIVGKLPKKSIKYITDHSNEVNQNTLLVVDKYKKFKLSYLNEAISKNLKIIITNRYYNHINLVQVIVKNLDKQVLKLIKYRQPFKPKKSIAITGTNGKTSTAWFLAQICKINKVHTKLTGTIGYFQDLKKVKESKLTTPNNLDLYQFSYSHIKNKFHLISEASSHGLHQGRFNDFSIDIAAITNLSHDHLDYHKNYISYVKSKLILFHKILKINGTAIINSRLKNYKSLLKKLQTRNIKVITFGSKDVFFTNGKNLNLSVFKKNYKIKNLKVNKVQKENLECAISCALAMGISIRKILNSLNKLKAAPGRFEIISYKKKTSSIIIDYAHTPEALKNLLKSYTQNKVKPSIVFGCGGNRDKSKRKKMAIIAKKYAQNIYITDDNPRYENPEIIRKTLKKYCPKGLEISDRKKAIKIAISKIKKNEILIIAGKGHEKYQIIKNKKIKFDDYKIAKSFIK